MPTTDPKQKAGPLIASPGFFTSSQRVESRCSPGDLDVNTQAESADAENVCATNIFGQLRAGWWSRRRRLRGSARAHAGHHPGTWHHARAWHHARSTGRGTRPTRAAGEDIPLPRSGRRPAWTTGDEHAMVMVAIVVVTMPRDRGTGKEDDRHHEHNSRDDHDPRRDLVKPAGLCHKRRLRRGARRPGGCRRRGGRRRLGRSFRCLGHALNHAQPIAPVHRARQEITRRCPGGGFTPYPQHQKAHTKSNAVATTNTIPATIATHAATW